jgi:hypothetical protein
MKKLIIFLLLACSFGLQAQVIRPLSYTTIQKLTIDTLWASHVITTTATFTGVLTGGDSITVDDLAYNGTTWNNSMGVPTRNAVRDKIAAIDANYTIDTAKFVRLGGRTGGQTIAQKVTLSFDSTIVANAAYNATTWNNSNAIPTKNALRDQLVLLAPIASPTFTGTVNGGDSTLVPTRVYSATTWNNSTGVPTMDALRDKFAADDATYTADSAKFVRLGGRAGGQTIALLNTFSFDSTLVTNAAYNATTWNNSTAIPTKNALRDQFVLLAPIAAPTFTGTVGGGDSVLVVNEAFNGTTWNNSNAAPTKNAVRDEMLLKATVAAPVFTGTVSGGDSTLVTTRAFNTATWNNSTAVPTMDAVRDQLVLKSAIADAETITGVKKFTGHNLYAGEITTATDTLALAVATHYTVLADATSSAILLTLPAASTCEGSIIRVKCINADAEVKIITAGGTIDATVGATGITLSVWDGREFMSNGTNWYIISKF